MKRKLNLKIQSPVQETQQLKIQSTQDGTFQTQNQSIIFNQNGYQNAEVKYKLSELTMIKLIGRGSFGSVYLVEAPNHQKYALKEIPLSQDETIQKNVYREIHSYVDYKHPKIVSSLNLYGEEGKISVLLPYALYGSLLQLMRRVPGKKLNENAIGIISCDILQALQEIHKKGIIHRDIKPDNILLFEDGVAKLADFGVATLMLQHDKKQSEQTFAGSISFMAPERFTTGNVEQQAVYGTKSDIYSYGISVLQLVEGKLPYDIEFHTIYDAMETITGKEPPKITQDMGYTKDFCDFVSMMLQKDPNQRASAGELLQSRFIKKFLKKEQEIRKYFIMWLRDNVDKQQ